VSHDNAGPPGRPAQGDTDVGPQDAATREKRLALRKLHIAARLIQDSAFALARQSDAKTIGSLVRISAQVEALHRSLTAGEEPDTL
jgi:hypothetical protein